MLLRLQGRRTLLHGREKAAGRAGTSGSSFPLARIFLDKDSGSVLASASGDGSGPAISAFRADPWPRLAPRVAGAAGSLDYLIRGSAPCEVIRC
jgi:hypothetical protein